MLVPGIEKETFFLLYSSLVEARVPGAVLVFEGPGALAVTPPGKDTHRLYLDNLYLMCARAPEEGEATIERFLLTLEASIVGESPQVHQIVAQVKDQTFVDAMKASAHLVREHLAGDLWVIYAADFPTNIRSVKPEELEALGIARDGLRALALENLKRILPEIECHGEGPSYLLTAGGDYVASLLLIDEVWESVAGQVEGDVVAVAPTRDMVLFAGAGSAEGIAAIRRSGRELAATGDHAVSDTLLRRVGGGWKVFD